jgi:hypothetical protein
MPDGVSFWGERENDQGEPDELSERPARNPFEAAIARTARSAAADRFD